MSSHHLRVGLGAVWCDVVRWCSVYEVQSCDVGVCEVQSCDVGVCEVQSCDVGV